MTAKRFKRVPGFHCPLSQERFAAAKASARSKWITCSTGSICTPLGGERHNGSLPFGLGFLQRCSFAVQISVSSACQLIPSDSDQEQRCKCCITAPQHPRARTPSRFCFMWSSADKKAAILAFECTPCCSRVKSKQPR